jgi:hypothetical protein
MSNQKQDTKQDFINNLRTDDVYTKELGIYYKKALEAPSANKIKEYASLAADNFELTKVVDKAVYVLDRAQTEIDQLIEDKTQILNENKQLKKDMKEYDSNYRLPEITRKQVVSVDRVQNAKRLWERYD